MPRPVLLVLVLASALVGSSSAPAQAGRETRKHLIYRTTFAAALTEGRIRNVPVFVSRHKDECGRCRRQHEQVLTNAAFVKWANEHLVVAIAHNEMLHEPVEEKGEGGETTERCPLYPGMTCREHVNMAVDVDNGRGDDLIQIPFLELCPNSWLVLPDGKVVRIEETDQFDPKRVRAIVAEHQKTLGKALSVTEVGILQTLVDAARQAYEDESWNVALAAWSAVAERVPRALSVLEAASSRRPSPSSTRTSRSPPRTTWTPSRTTSATRRSRRQRPSSRRSTSRSMAPTCRSVPASHGGWPHADPGVVRDGRNFRDSGPRGLAARGAKGSPPHPAPLARRGSGTPGPYTCAPSSTPGLLSMCGFIGIHAGPRAAYEVADALLALQHRGQDAAGVVSFDGDAFHVVRGRGLVHEVFRADDPTNLPALRGNVAIGHTRYPTVGGGTSADAQPLYTNSPYGIAMAHNGNVTNFPALKKELAEQDLRRLGTDCDVEAILNVFASALRRHRKREWPEAAFQAMGDVFRRVRGSYSGVAIVGTRGLVAFRDPYGIKPAVIGRRKNGKKNEWCVASESAALNVLGFDLVGDLDAGEVVVIDPAGRMKRRVVTPGGTVPHRPCVFEFIYFARPDSVLDDISVYKARLRLGESLAQLVHARGLHPDVVVPVPDSARPAALECARELDVRYREGLLKNRYIGRTFIMPDQENRRKKVMAKLTTLPMELEGKKVLLVDDSLIRGTTTRAVVEMVRRAGAVEVYVGISSPKIKYPCVYGIDMQTRKEFLARREGSDKKIAEAIGADAVVYMTIPRMVEAVRGPTSRVEGFCKACMDGDYPTGDVTPAVLRTIESERTRACRTGIGTA